MLSILSRMLKSELEKKDFNEDTIIINNVPKNGNQTNGNYPLPDSYNSDASVSGHDKKILSMDDVIKEYKTGDYLRRKYIGEIATLLIKMGYINDKSVIESIYVMKQMSELESINTDTGIFMCYLPTSSHKNEIYVNWTSSWSSDTEVIEKSKDVYSPVVFIAIANTHNTPNHDDVLKSWYRWVLDTFMSMGLVSETSNGFYTSVEPSALARLVNFIIETLEKSNYKNVNVYYAPALMEKDTQFKRALTNLQNNILSSQVGFNGNYQKPNLPPYTPNSYQMNQSSIPHVGFNNYNHQMHHVMGDEAQSMRFSPQQQPQPQPYQQMQPQALPQALSQAQNEQLESDIIDDLFDTHYETNDNLLTETEKIENPIKLGFAARLNI